MKYITYEIYFHCKNFSLSVTPLVKRRIAEIILSTEVLPPSCKTTSVILGEGPFSQAIFRPNFDAILVGDQLKNLPNAINGNRYTLVKVYQLM